MNLIQNILTIWGSTSSLASAVPTNRVFNGPAPPDINPPNVAFQPYVVLRAPALTPSDKSNFSNYDNQKLVIQGWFNKNSSAYELGQLVLTTFRDIDFDLETGTEALNLCLDTHNILEETSDPTQKRWQSITEFKCLIRSNRPA